MSGRIAEAVTAYVVANGWDHVIDDGRGVVSFPASGQHGQWMVHVSAREDDEQVLVHSVLGDDVPDDRRIPLAVFLTRANFGLVIGNFELDLDDGELRYKTSLDVEGAELSHALIDHLVLANVGTTDRYLPGIHAVLAGSDPLLAVDDVEAAR